jgi:predicted ABC-type ATPase
MDDAFAYAPRAIIIAGPNGAGKTTFAREFLPAEGACATFLNADLIAAGLSPFDPEKMAIESARIMLDMVEVCLSGRRDFAVETTLAGRSYVRRIDDWQRRGFRVHLLFLELPSADLAVERVRHRVAHGGHDIPEHVIRRRFERGTTNFWSVYRDLVDAWQRLDACHWPPTLVEKGTR